MIDKIIIIIFIHSWIVSMVTGERESHMLHHDIWLLRTYLQPQSFTIFFNQYCSNLLKNATVRGLK